MKILFFGYFTIKNMYMTNGQFKFYCDNFLLRVCVWGKLVIKTRVEVNQSIPGTTLTRNDVPWWENCFLFTLHQLSFRLFVYMKIKRFSSWCLMINGKRKPFHSYFVNVINEEFCCCLMMILMTVRKKLLKPTIAGIYTRLTSPPQQTQLKIFVFNIALFGHMNVIGWNVLTWFNVSGLETQLTESYSLYKRD